MNNTAIYLVSDGMGGAEQVVWQTLNAFRNNQNIYFIVNNEIAAHFITLLPENRVLNVGSIYLHFNRRFKFIKYFLNNRFYSVKSFVLKNKTRLICKYVTVNNIVNIHSHLELALFSSILIKKKISHLHLIFTVHGLSGLLPDGLLKPEIPLRKIDFLKIDRFVFVSEYVCTFYKNNNIPIRDYKIIYNGIDPTVFKEYYRLSLKNDVFTILYVGGSKYVKGYDYLIDTVELLLQGHKELKFKVVVLGILSYNCKLVNLVKEKSLDHVFELVGYIKPPHHLEYFNSADVLFMPSRSEALPIAAIEAVFLDLPVIASNVGGLPEIIKQGENGLLGNNDPLEFSNFIIELFKNYNPFLDKTRNWNIKIKSQFEVKEMYKKLLSVYSSIGFISH